MAANKPGYQAPPEFLPDDKEHRRQLARALRGLMQGKANVTLDVTLVPNATSTTVTDARIGFYSAVIPAMALTADAASDLAAGLWVGSLAKGSCVLNHRNAAQTDRTIRLVILG
jgi:hypothetical protein